ncbi:MAG: hypothetical protein FJX71_06535 [Alphaproteobacteria bacterium]|nr:hypothetical protein [Alphaproteobacteria bacterium]
MVLRNQNFWFKFLFLCVAYSAHGLPFAGVSAYMYALLTAYFLLFGVLRTSPKIIFVWLGFGILCLGRFVPHLEIPEQQRLLIDDHQNLIPLNKFLKDEFNYPYFMTADGFHQGFINKRMVDTIDISKGVLSLRSGWINRPDFNFIPDHSPYKREELPFVVRYEITPQMLDMTLLLKGIFLLKNPNEEMKRLEISPSKQDILLTLQKEHIGYILYGFGGKWDESGVHDLQLRLKKSEKYNFFDAFRLGSLFLGLGLFFYGLFTIRFTRDWSIQTFFLILSVILFWFDFSEVLRWGVLARGGMDGVIHDGYAYLMLEEWAKGNWREALMSPEHVFYFMPGMRYLRFLELLIFGNAYIFQACLLLFVPIIFYRFFSFFLRQSVGISLTLITFFYLLDGCGLSQKLYQKSFINLYGEGVAYAFLFISLTLLSKSINKIGWGFIAFFLLSISISIRPNLLVFVSVIAVIHLITTTFTTQSWMSRVIMLFGLSPVILIPIHNYIGGEFYLISKASEIPQNVSLTLGMYQQVLSYFLDFEKNLVESSRFLTHFKQVYPHYVIAWLGCLWITFRGQTKIIKSLALATFSGLSVHLFYTPLIRYIHPYLTIAIVIGLYQISQFRVEEKTQGNKERS